MQTSLNSLVHDAGGDPSWAQALLQVAATFSNFAAVRTAANLTGWTAKTVHSPCTWSNVSCSAQGNLTELDLSSLGLIGALA